MAFEQMQDTQKPHFVIDQVLSSIQDGTLAVGERLPSEAKLAELTGVGRTSVREALAALRLMGVVETRVGAGSYIATPLDGTPTPMRAASEIGDAISKSSEAVQLQEARAVFETGMVRLSAARWNSEKAEQFERLLAAMDEAADSEGYEDYIRLHRDFHLALARATDNAVVEATERSFLESMDHEGWKDMERQSYLPNRRDYLTNSAKEHRAIFEAVRTGDGAQASELVHKHYVRHEEIGDES
jgi:GntR family transcriptional regulator, transcriptional repressor for pyruvate dehydrogenase complex